MVSFVPLAKCKFYFCVTSQIEPYFSPQIVSNQTYDPFKADVWASGVVLYAMLHNRFPFHFKDTSELLNEQTDIAYKTDRLARNLSKELKALILHLFEPEEAKRPSFQEVLKDKWVLSRGKDS